MNVQPSIRRLLASDLNSYRSLRLEALASSPASFASSFQREQAMTDAQWLHRLEHPDSAVFGLYLGEEIVGITGVVVDQSEAAQGIMVQSYLNPAARGERLSYLFYESRLAWARERGLSRLVTAHRCDNLASRAAMVRQGFQFTHSEPLLWPDGVEAELWHYVLDL